MRNLNLLTYNNLRLRGVEHSDIGLLFDVESDVDAWPDSDMYAPLTHEALSKYADSYTADPYGDGQLRMIAEDDASGNVVGIIDLYQISPIHRRAFIGIYVVPEMRRHGFAIKMLTAAAVYARNRLNLTTLAARVLADNTASISLFNRAGFSCVATIPDWHFADGRFHDLSLFLRNLMH